MKKNRFLIRFAAGAAAALIAASCAGCSIREQIPALRLAVPSDIGFDNQPNDTVLAYDEISTTYYRDSLEPDEQQVYDLMKLALSNPQRPTSRRFDSEIEFDAEQMKYISDCVWIDNPVFAQTQTGAISYSFNQDVLTLTLNQSEQDYQAHMLRASEALEKAKELAATVDASWSDYDKVKYLHDEIAKSCYYSLETEDANNEAYGVFVLGRSKCEGYTDALTMLCNLVGIDCTATWFDGYTPEDGGDVVNGHVWNVVQIEGEYYHIDASTNDGNTKMNGKEQIRPKDQISHVRFGLTTEEFKSIFPEGVTFNERNENAFPPCTATKYQYFRLNGFLFDSYSREEVADALVRSYQKGSQEGQILTEVQFSNRAAFDAAVADADYLVGLYFPKAGLSYSGFDSSVDDRSLVLGISPSKQGG